MPRTIRYHLNEHCPRAIADVLRRLGIDVTTTTEAGLLGAPDEAHLAFGQKDGRVIFTQDDDFLKLSAEGSPYSGITYCRQQTRSIGEITDLLILIWEVCDPGEMVGRVEYL